MKLKNKYCLQKSFLKFQKLFLKINFNDCIQFSVKNKQTPTLDVADVFVYPPKEHKLKGKYGTPFNS